jgi:hypothetical protein
VVSKEEFAEWQNSYITKRFFQFLKDESYLQRNNAAMGACKRKSFIESGEEYSNTMLRADVYDNIVDDTQYEDVFPESIEETKTDESNPEGVQGVGEG